MELEADAFLDLVHFYRLSVVHDPEAREQLNNVLSGGLLIDQERPPMMTEAARKIAPPSWWKGATTETDALSIVDGLKKGRMST